MNKKTLILCIVALAALAALAAGAIAVLYSGGGKSDVPSAEVPSAYSLLGAVPSDAAMMLSTSRLETAAGILNDTTVVLGSLFDDASKASRWHAFVSWLSGAPRQMRGCPAVVSMHYSGDLTPLLVVAAGRDSSSAVATMLAAADSAGIYGRYVSGRGLLVFSSSETLAASSVRHLDEGVSVLDKEGVAPLAASLGGRDAIFVSHEYSGKLFTTHVQRSFQSYSSFFRKFAQWSGFGLKHLDGNLLSLSFESFCPSDPSYFANLASSMTSGESRAADMLPSNTVFAVSMTTPDLVGFLEKYKLYLDASGRLDKYKQAQVRDSLGYTPEQAAVRLGVKETVKAAVRVDGDIRNLVAVLPGKADAGLVFAGTGVSSFKEYSGEVLPLGYADNIKAVFGGLFSSPAADSFIYRDGWIIASDRKTLEWMVSDVPQSLRDYLSDAGVASRIPKASSILVYYSLSEFPPQLRETFKSPLSSDLMQTLSGISFEPMIFSLSGGSGSLSVDRIVAVKSDNPVVAEKDTVVEVPKGPFRVPNSQTGRTNLFGQSDNLTLTLKEEDGKGIWGIPFKASLCGFVEPVDYYNNGKIQYLFAAGSKLYLIDRLGRFVSGFPSELGKEVLLGPAVYDFTGAHGYSAMILHKDNTLVLYDLHGRVRDGWKTIKGEETIKSLPELMEFKGKKYWVVRTSVRTQIYAFDGGEPLVKAEGQRMIRPDSGLEFKDGGTVSATCYDGKVRSIRIQDKQK